MKERDEGQDCIGSVYNGVGILGQGVQVSTMLKIKPLQELKFTNPSLHGTVPFMCVTIISPGLT